MQCDPSGSRGKLEWDEIASLLATPEPALSGAEILRLRLRMTTSERACNDDQARHEAKASHYKGAR